LICTAQVGLRNNLKEARASTHSMSSDLRRLQSTRIASDGSPRVGIHAPPSPWAVLIQSVKCLACAMSILATVSTAELTWAQQTAPPVDSSVSTGAIFGGSGTLFLSQFANPALRGSLYLTPQWPMTGYYSIYPGSRPETLPGNGVAVGPLRVRPHMGVAQMYTDNVFRTNSNKTSDFLTTLSPGIQVQLPFGGFHSFLIDYRTNLQYYARTPSNDVHDQTAIGAFKFNFPGGLRIDLQGEHKRGHDPRGSAVDDVNTQRLGVNKWTANSFTGHAEYLGAQSSVGLLVQTIRWDYLNNDQGLIRDRLTNRADLMFTRRVTDKTSLLASVGMQHSLYDQNKNLDNIIYTFSGGATWNATEGTSADILAGYQIVQFTRAQVNQPPPLDRFFRDDDTYSNFYFMGRLNWQATPLLRITLQLYRTVQQTVSSGSLFYTATGVNLGARHALTDRTALTLNLGYEHDKFQSSSLGGTTGGADRSEDLKNVAVGVNYRAVEWVGLGAQYIFEDRHSTQTQFTYQANTFMLSAQTVF
jgi:polysaccharide biosynthesis protein VpsM